MCVMQAALVSVAASPITLLVISIADFSKHATPEVLRVMRDEVGSYLLLYNKAPGHKPDSAMDCCQE